MDQNARTLLLWEHACCGDRYWSGARLCDRCGAVAFQVLFRMTLADAMSRMHVNAKPTAAPAPPQAPSVQPSPPTAPVPASRVAGPIQRRPPVRHEDDEERAVRPAAGPPSDPGLTFLLGMGVAGAFVFLVTCLLMLA